MKMPLVMVLLVVASVSGCAKIRESRINPFNWFGTAQPAAPATLYTAPGDARALVGQVTVMKVEPFQGGAIVRATGVPETQGYYDAELVPLPVDDKGKLVFEFRIFPPAIPAAAGTPYSRQVTVAAAISDIKLQGVGTIVVQGASNALSARR